MTFSSESGTLPESYTTVRAEAATREIPDGAFGKESFGKLTWSETQEALNALLQYKPERPELPGMMVGGTDLSLPSVNHWAGKGDSGLPTTNQWTSIGDLMLTQSGWPTEDHNISHFLEQLEQQKPEPTASPWKPEYNSPWGGKGDGSLPTINQHQLDGVDDLISQINQSPSWHMPVHPWGKGDGWLPPKNQAEPSEKFAELIQQMADQLNNHNDAWLNKGDAYLPSTNQIISFAPSIPWSTKGDAFMPSTNQKIKFDEAIWRERATFDVTPSIAL